MLLQNIEDNFRYFIDNYFGKVSRCENNHILILVQKQTQTILEKQYLVAIWAIDVETDFEITLSLNNI
jgi:hypothetical protein